MTRIRIGEPLLPRMSSSGPSGAADLPSGGRTASACSAPEAHPPRADPPVDLVRKVWGFSDGASQKGEGSCLAALLPRGVIDYLRCRCPRNRHAYGLGLAL